MIRNYVFGIMNRLLESSSRVRYGIIDSKDNYNLRENRLTEI